MQVRHIWLGVFMPFVVLALLGSCRQESRRLHTPVFHCAAYDIDPDSVDMHTGVILRAEGDSAIQIRVEGNTLRTVHAEPVPHSRGAFTYSSDHRIFDALLRLETSRTPGDVYSYLTPYELYLNPFVGAEGERLLLTRLKNDYIIPSETRRYCWPVINDNPQWLLAACELFNITADRSALDRLGRVAAKVSAEERRVCVNPATGLVTGVPRYMVGQQECFPSWMKPTDIMECATFGVNSAWWGALHSMEEITAAMAKRNEIARIPELHLDADTLRSAIFRTMWNPAQGSFAAMMYGSPLWQLPMGASDNLAQGLAILTGLPMEGMVEMMAGRSEAPATGVGLFYPGINTVIRLHTATEMLVQTLWAAAMGRSGNDEAYSTAVGALIYSICGDILSSNVAQPFLRQPLTGLVLRGFCGITTAFDGLYFAPSVPSGLPGNKRIEGLRYRRADLTITISGTGNILSAFRVDGKDTEPFFPASAEGHHEIEIVLSGDATRSSDTAASAPEGVVLPGVPDVEWISERNASFVSSASIRDGEDASATSGDIYVYLDGVITGDVPTRHYTLFEATDATVVQFCRVAGNRWIGFSTAPHMYVPDGALHVVNMADVARGGTRIIQDKELATRFVESNRYKNARIGFTVDVAEAGEYVVDVRYINGLGVVNPRRRTALRHLSVDGELCGVFVFPQLSASDWDTDPEKEWQSQTSYTNPLPVWLDKGEHRMELRFYQPNPVYIDPASNTILADCVRVMRIGDRKIK